MAFDLSSITNEVRLRAPRIVLLGEQKIGKSTFASCAGTPAMLPIKGEEGLDDPEIQTRAKILPVCNTLADVIGWLWGLGEQEHNHQTVVIDSVSALEPIIHAEICQDAGGAESINDGSLKFGVGTDRALNAWRQITEILDALRTHKNMTSILIGHIKTARFSAPEGGSYDQYQWDIHHKAASLLYRWADSILFCNTKVVVVEEKLGFHKDNVMKRGREVEPGARFLYTQKRPAHPGGGRGVYGQLPYELPLSWTAYQDAIATRVAQMKG